MPLKVFTDGSVHTASGVGCGAALFVPSEVGEPEPLNLASLQNSLQHCRFSQTNSTRLEFQVFLWTIESLFSKWEDRWESQCIRHASQQERHIEFYTDSQAIVHLPERRARIEGNQYCSKKGRPLANADLYKTFFASTDRLAKLHVSYQLIKVEGHKPTKSKNQIDTLFSLVDKAARNAVRQLGSGDCG